MTQTTPEATERWSLSTLPVRDRAEGWRQVVAETHLPWRIAAVEQSDRAFDARLRRSRFGDIDLVHCHCGVSRGDRGVRELSATPGEFIGLLCVVSGYEVLEQDGREVRLRAGDIALWDSTRPARFAVLGPLVKRTLLIPRDRLAGICGDPAGLTAALSRGRDASALVIAHLDAVQRVSPRLDAVAAAAAMNAALELIGAAFSPKHRPSPGAIDAGLRARIDAYIDIHLGDVALDPRQIAAAHAISVRSLHALFEPRGESVSARVRRLRLTRAHRELAVGAVSSITELSVRWGFRDGAHFSRLFRHRFGESPRDVRARSGDPARPSPVLPKAAGIELTRGESDTSR